MVLATPGESSSGRSEQGFRRFADVLHFRFTCSRSDGERRIPRPERQKQMDRPQTRPWFSSRSNEFALLRIKFQRRGRVNCQVFGERRNVNQRSQVPRKIRDRKARRISHRFRLEFVNRPSSPSLHPSRPSFFFVFPSILIPSRLYVHAKSIRSRNLLWRD